MIAGTRTSDPTPSTRDRAANVALAVLLLVAFIGRSATSSDGEEILSVSLAFLVQGRFEAAIWPYAADSFFEPWSASTRL